MTLRENYLARLKELLAAMPPADREEVLADISEHFDAALREGETEEEIIARLGTPESIATQYGYAAAAAPPAAGAAGRQNRGVGAGRIFGSIGLGFFNLCAGYPVLFVFWAAAAALAAAAVSIGLSGLLYLVCLCLSPAFSWAQDSLMQGFPLVANLFTGIGLVSFGALACIWAVKLFILCIKVGVRYLVWSFKWIFCMKTKKEGDA